MDAHVQLHCSKNLIAGRPGTVESEPHLRIALVGDWKRQG
jgi:hypothetical protein